MAAQAAGHPAGAPSGPASRAPVASTGGTGIGPSAGEIGTAASTMSTAGKPRHSPSANGGHNEMADTYLYLIAALDQGVERGDVSPESHALIRGNLKRRLETILADEPHAKAR